MNHTASSHIEIIAPALGHPAASSAESFGSAAWLWMHSRQHSDLPLMALNNLLLPSIGLQQYILLLQSDHKGKRPIAFLCWANLNAQTEKSYIQSTRRGLQSDQWNSGDRMWITDWLTPFGHAPHLHRIAKSLLAKASLRFIAHRGHERGFHIRIRSGAQVEPAHAMDWWRERPLLINKPQAEGPEAPFERTPLLHQHSGR
jgi:cytolysin-activating lysine-acyltransferase